MLASAAGLDGTTISGVGSSLLKYFGPNKIKPISVGEKKPNTSFAFFPAYERDREGYAFPLSVFTQMKRANMCTNAAVVGEIVIVGNIFGSFHKFV